jgi:hypothetical protein
MKTLSYRLFGIGKVTDQLAAELKLEGLVLLDEGIKCSATYIDFRAPGKYSNWKRRWFSGSIALTQVRLVAQQYAEIIIDVPLRDERLRSMQIALDGDALLIAFDARLFHPDWSGKVEYRFRTPHARAFLDRLPKQ